MLTRRDHSAYEVYEKLRAKRFQEDQITEVIRLLVDEKLISDERFAEAYTQMRVEKGFGPNKIRIELRNRGVDRDLIDTEIDKYTDSWSAHAARAREKKFGAGVPQEWAEKVRQARFLQARGFLPQHIHEILNLNDA